MNKKNKIIIAVLLICLMAVGGGTLAYFNSRHSTTTSLSTDVYQTRVTDTFTSPENFIPGTYIERDMKLTNTGDVKVAVRAKIEESWTDSNGNELSLAQEIQNTANENRNEILPSFMALLKNCAQAILFNTNESTIGKSSTCDQLGNTFSSPNWSKNNMADMSDGMLNMGLTQDSTQDSNNNDEYYYYKFFVNPGQSTTPLISSILFNENIENSYTCTEENGTESCVSTGTGYDNATYTLRVTFETVQYDKYQEYWNTNYDIQNYYYNETLTDTYSVEGWGENKTVDLSGHNYTITNTSDVAINVRAKIVKNWTSENEILCLANGNNGDCFGNLATINLKENNNGDIIWEEDENDLSYYVYYAELQPGESVSSLINSITYESTYACGSMLDSTTCSGEAYANDTLNITVTYELIDTDYKDVQWYGNSAQESDSQIREDDMSGDMMPYSKQ